MELDKTLESVVDFPSSLVELSANLAFDMAVFVSKSSTVPLNKGEHVLIPRSTLSTVSLGNTFVDCIPSCAILDREGKVVRITTAPKMGAGAAKGHEKWNQNPHRNEKLFPVDFTQTHADVGAYVFFAIVAGKKEDGRGDVHATLCDDTGKVKLATYHFRDCNAHKGHVAAILKRAPGGKDWLFCAVGESIMCNGLEEVAENCHSYMSPPRFILLQVVEARGLRAFDRGGSSDPYITIKSNRQFFQTRTIKKTLNPVFNEVFRLGYWTEKAFKEKDILFEMYDYDALSKDDVMGIILIDNDEILDAGGSFDQWLPLEADHRIKESKVKGELHIIATPLERSVMTGLVLIDMPH